MAKIQITENELKQIIRESVETVLREASNQNKQKAYTFAQLLSPNVLGQQYSGNGQQLGKYVINAYHQLCKEKGVKPLNITSNTPISAGQWVQVLNKAKSMDRTGTLTKTYDDIIRGITAKSVSQGIEDIVNKGGTLVPANPYSTGPGDENATPNSGKHFTFTQLAQSLGNKRGTTMSFQQVLHDSTGPWNGQDENSVKTTITSQIKRAKPTISASNPQNAQKAEQILNNWLQGGTPYRINDVHWAMNIFDQAVRTSRNDMPVVKGFQNTLNAFGFKTATGKPYAPNGVLDQNTSAALKQNGFKDILDFKNTVVEVQKALGVEPDGKVGNITLGAFQRGGINSFDTLKNYPAFIAKKRQDTLSPINNTQNALGPTTNQPQVTAPTQAATLARPKAAAPGNTQA